MALKRRIPLPGLVHHSVCGAKYASRNHNELLKSRGITISLSGEEMRAGGRS
jgi:hypothetical protein